MIVRLNTGKNVTGALQYNEQKLQFGDATILSATNFSFPSSQHNRIQRSLELNRLAGKNHRVQQPGIHFALSYHPSEKPTDEQMRQVAAHFMVKMGYADQPYVVYRHSDRPHPHLHIVSVQVDRQGKRLSDSHIKRRCNTARKELEIQYELVKAEEQNQSLPQIQSLSTLTPADQPIELADGDIKRAIGNVVRTAFTDYSFSSFEDFDGFLNQYGIRMNRQEGKGDRLEGAGKWRGITFQLVAADNPVTPRIKASSYSFGPTADRLENRFRGGAARKQQQRGALLHTIKQTLAPYPTLSEDDYKRLLREAGVQVVGQGDRYLYIDHNRRAVYGDAELGAGFVRKQLLNRFGTTQIHPTHTHSTSTTEKKGTPPSLTSKTSPSATETPKPSLDPAQPKPAQSSAPEKPAISRSGTTRSDSDWGKLLSKFYQQHRQQSGVYFESGLIESFPHDILRTQLVAAGHPAEEVSRALVAFESYKQGCLPEIRAKEQAYFNQTATALLALAVQMPVDGPGRLSFLKAAQLNVRQGPTGKYSLSHQQQPALNLELSPEIYQKLAGAVGPALLFNRPLTKAERDTYLWAAGLKAPRHSFYELNHYTLTRSLPPVIYAGMSPLLNQQYLDDVLIRVASTSTPDLAQALFNRGIVLRREGATIAGGFYNTPPESFVVVKEPHQTALAGSPFLSISQTEGALRLDSTIGRRLIELHQGIDLGSTARQDWVAGKVNTALPDLALLKGKALGDALSELVGELPLSKLQARKAAEPITIGVKGKSKRPDDVSRVIWKAYFKYRQRDGFSYESTLLNQPTANPHSSLMTALVTELPAVRLSMAKEYVDAFLAHRHARYAAIKANDDTHFRKACDGFLELMSTAPVGPGERVGLLSALYLKLERQPSGLIELVHEWDKTLRLKLTGEQAVRLMTPPPEKQWVAVPTKEFPRLERELLERVLFGDPLRKGMESQAKEKQGADPKPNPKNLITFGRINTERIKTLLTKEQFEAASGWLNKNSMEEALPRMPLVISEALPWLQQRGFILDRIGSGQYTIGYQATQRDSFHPLPHSTGQLLEKAQLAQPGLILPYEAAISRQTSPEPIRGRQQPDWGKSVRGLAHALDSGQPSQIRYASQQVVKNFSQLKPFQENPQQLLKALWQGDGVEPRTELQNAFDPTWGNERVDVTDQTGQSAGESIADALGSEEVRRKKRITDNPKKFRPKR